MEDLEALIGQIRSPSADPLQRQDAFAELVERFQDMAYGFAYAILEDPQLAQDAAQEAFITAYRSLAQLQEPKAFPGWFRRVVLTHCHRLTRGQRVATQPVGSDGEPAASQPGPAAVVEEQELMEGVQAAIQALPERQRTTAILYYIDGYSQREVAEFLEVPVAVVKERLHRARAGLRERMLRMVRDDLQAQRPSKDDQFAQSIKLAMALETAAQESQLTVLEMFLVDGLDVNARGRDGQTPLHWAAQRGNVGAAEMLLRYGADPRLADNSGRTPLQWAVEKGHREVAALLRQQSDGRG